MATIKEIAEKAGVSRGTVDRVMNNRGKVAPEKEKLIKKIAKELNYTPNIVGKSLSLRKKQLQFVFFYLDPKYFPYMNLVLDGAQKASEKLKEYGVNVEFLGFDCYTSNEEPVNDILIPYLEKNQVDGLVMDGLKSDVLCKIYKEKKKELPPIMTFDVPFSEEGPLGYIGCDYEQYGKLAVALIKMTLPFGGKLATVSYDVFEKSFDNPCLRTIRNAFSPESSKIKLTEYFIPMGKLEADKAKAIAESVVADPNIRVLYLMNPADYSILNYLKQLDKEHRIGVLVNELPNDRSKEMLSNGTIDLAICQDLEILGYNSLGHLFDTVAMGVDKKERYEKTRLNIILKENMDTAY